MKNRFRRLPSFQSLASIHYGLVPFLSLFLIFGFLAPPTLPLPPNVDGIQSRGMKHHLSFLASKELGGRYTLSSGNRVAARYLASQLEFYGFRGAMPDGSFFQSVPFVTREIDFSKSTIKLGNTSTEFMYGEDFVGNDLFGPPQKADLKADLVFVGYGISSPANGYDDYKGLDLKGKIAAFIMSGKPKELNGKVLQDSERGIEAATSHGCTGAMILPDEYLTNAWPQMKAFVASRHKQKQLTGPAQEGTETPSKIPTVIVSPTLASHILESLKVSHSSLKALASTGDTLKPAATNLSCQILIHSQEITENSQNVVGILEGRDPELKKQFIVLSAHYDHLEATDKDIYPGADDDGSGTTGVLEAAHVFAQGERPRRSILILFNTGEELGLIGSSYFIEHPLVPLDQIVADFNVDMIGRSRPAQDTNPQNAKLTDANSIYLIGSDKHSSELNEISEQTNQDLTKMRLDYTYNNESDPSRLFYRSDHWNFAKKGIPIIFYFNGEHEDYHRPTDTVDKIDFEKMARVIRLVYATSWRVANLDHRLKIDKWNQPKPVSTN